MDGKSFIKLCKDCGLTNKQCTPTQLDLIFAKNKERTARKINFQQFCAALEGVATARSQSMPDMEAQILQHGGPSFAGT